MELWLALELLRYWRDHPPVHELFAGFMGFRPRLEPAPASADDPSGFGALIRRFPDGRVPADH